MLSRSQYLDDGIQAKSKVCCADTNGRCWGEFHHAHTGYPSAPSGGTCMTYLASSWNSIFHMLSHNSAIELYHFIPLDLGYSYLCEFCFKSRSDLHHRRLIKPDRNLFYQPKRSWKIHIVRSSLHWAPASLGKRSFTRHLSKPSSTPPTDPAPRRWLRSQHFNRYFSIDSLTQNVANNLIGFTAHQ